MREDVVALWVLGLAMIWLYAAIRPRIGAGPGTAVCTGLFVWFLIWVWCLASMSMIWGLFPGDLVAIIIIWGLVEVILAAVAGVWLYQEGLEAEMVGSDV